MKFREVIQKHLPADKKLPEVPAAKLTIEIPAFQLDQIANLAAGLPAPKSNSTPLTFEDLNQDYGFVLYQTQLLGGKRSILKLKELRDYAIVMVNGKTVGTMDRRLNQDSLQVNLPAGQVTLDILVENLGRINFGKYLLQNKKGITEKVIFDGNELKNWKMYSLPFNDIKKIRFASAQTKADAPVLRKGIFNLNQIADTYLDLSNWGKGVVWVNGYNLGRYWNIGPQQTVYLPAEWLKKDGNEVVVLELLKTDQTLLKGTKSPVLDMNSSEKQSK